MRNFHILLVDDEDEFLHTLAERLQLRDFEIQTATDGEEALNLVAKECPDLVVLDAMMPGMSGLDVLKQLKADHPDLPIILLTGHGSTADGIEGMRLGAFDYLTKPIDLDELIKKMHEGIGV